MFNIILLIVAAVIWGFAFIAARWALVDFTPLWMHTIRYLLAAFFALPIIYFCRSYLKSWKLLKAPLIASLFLFIAMFLQTIGLTHTTVAKSGFITVLYAIFVPMISIIFLGKKYQVTYWFLVCLAILGIFFLCGMTFSNFNIGDLMTLGCAIFSAFHILYIGKIANNYKSAMGFNALQCLFIGLYGLILVLIFEGIYVTRIDADGAVVSAANFASLVNFNQFGAESALTGFIVLALFSSIFAFSIQVHTQKKISPHIISLIFLLESPFAAFFGFLLLKEGLTLINIIGCAMIATAVALIPFFARETKI